MQASRYHIERLIKKGGMAEVLAARVIGAGGDEEEVALKRILPELGDDEAFRKSFIDEARIASQLHHPNIVSVYDYGVLDEVPFLTMELVDGVDLAVLLELAAEMKQAVSPEVTLAIGMSVGRALAHAHMAKDKKGASLEIVHRDVTPQNVLISWQGEVKLADFGIARARDRITRTRVGVVKGKLGYMAPEQLDGGAIDGRADVFSLGCVLHQMLAGRTPLEPISDAKDPSRPLGVAIDAALPRDVLAIVKRATQWRKEMRYASAAELAAECESAFWTRVDAGDPKAAVAAWAGRHRARAAVLVAAAVAERAGQGGAAGPGPGPRFAKLKDLFDLDLSLVSEGQDAVRRFSSVARIPGEAVASSSPTEKTELAASGGTRAKTSSLEEQELKEIVQVLSKHESPLSSAEESDSKNDTLVLEGRPEDDLVGQILHGFRIEARIGAGISAVVYRARHQVLAKECAVKVLVARFASEDAAQRRLRREAETLGRIAHENIVGVQDFGMTADGKPFLMIELLRGRTLHQVIEREAPLHLSRVARLATQIASGLEEAHRHGLVHRDLKPANIMIVEGPRGETVKILDFGMVRILPATGALTKLTATGFLLGTPAYASPEQILKPSEVGGEADMYSLGVMMFEMLAGKRPFLGSVYDVLSAQLHDPPPPLGSFDGLESLVRELLEKDPMRRPTARDTTQRLLAALPTLGQGVPIAESLRSDRDRTLLPVRREPPRTRTLWVMLVGAGVLLGALAASAVAYVSRDEPSEPIEIEAPAVAKQKDPVVVPRTAEPAWEEEEDPSPAPSPASAAKTAPSDERKMRPAHPTRPRISPPIARDRDPKEPAAEPSAAAPELVVEKLRRISTLLTAASGRMSASELEAFENRYFALRTEARPPLDSARAKELAPKVTALETEILKRTRALE